MRLLIVLALVLLLAAVIYRPAAGGDADASEPKNDDGLGGGVGDYMDELERKFEGLRLKTYSDSAGNPTIGYGHKLGRGESYPNGINEGQAESLLQNDLQTAEKSVRDLVKVPLSDNQFLALRDWVFNLGAGKVAGSTLLQKLNAGDYGAVPQELTRWIYAGGKPSSDLEVRRAAEAQLWES